MSANTSSGHKRAATKTREITAKHATKPRNTERPALTTPEFNKNAKLLQSLETSNVMRETHLMRLMTVTMVTKLLL